MDEHDVLDTTVLRQLQERQRGLLDDIDRLRERGIGHHVGLPQLIVCGDQSSGKSSVLDAISRLRFPTDSGACTRFATEVILRRDAKSSISVSIKPGLSRSVPERDRLRQFQHEFSDAARFPTLVNEAKSAMGLNDETNKFTDDVLCVEICGPDRPHLTLVDLPGLIQDPPGDAMKVRQIVERYMSNERGVILAIVSAASDRALQSIFGLVKKHDPEGRRTMGVITKPDLLDIDSRQEDDMVRLAQNKTDTLHLGWHVLRNRSHGAKTISYEERDQEERDFLSRRVWSNIEPQFKGVSALRKRLSDVLLSHIERTLPEMAKEVREKLADSKARLDRLGPSRATPAQQRGYLIGLSSRFDRILREASEGQCLDEFFQDKADPDWSSKRLRAIIQKANHTFSERIHSEGHERRVTKKGPTPDTWTFSGDKSTFSTSEGPWASVGSGTKHISRDRLAEELDKRAENIRGREIPGFPNATLVGDLFRDQARPWRSLAQQHLRTSWQAVRKLLQLVLRHLTTDDIYRSLFAHSLDNWLKGRDAAMGRMLNLLLRPHEQGHPISYNPTLLSKKHQYSTTERREAIRSRIGPGTKQEGDPVTRYTVEQLMTALDNTESNNTFDSLDIIASTEAYYEIAMHTFVDNVASLVIEHCLVDELTTVFNPSMVGEMEDHILAKLAAESAETLAERKDLEERIKILDQGLATCLQHSSDCADDSTAYGSSKTAKQNMFESSRAAPLGTSSTASSNGAFGGIQFGSSGTTAGSGGVFNSTNGFGSGNGFSTASLDAFRPRGSKF